jgi:hypothetical protein
MRKRALITIASLLAVFVFASVVQMNGRVRPVSPQLSASVQNSASWYATPLIAASADDPVALYIVNPAEAAASGAAAVRIDTRTGEQTPSQIAVRPDSPFRFFSPAPVHAAVCGVRLQRPAVHLMKFPDGRGPGVHFTDSVTGRIEVVLDGAAGRTLLRRNVFNSSETETLLSLVVADSAGPWIAALWRKPSTDWILYLFSRQPSGVT